MLQQYFYEIFKSFDLQSVGVANAAWQSEWFDADLRYKKKLLMVIMRGHRPQYLRAYKFSVASMDSFSHVSNSMH